MYVARKASAIVHFTVLYGQVSFQVNLTDEKYLTKQRNEFELEFERTRKRMRTRTRVPLVSFVKHCFC